MPNRFSRYAFLLALLLVVPIAGWASGSESKSGAETDDQFARSILEKSDRIRFPQESFQVDIGVISSSEGQDSETRKYRVLSKGNENTIVQIVEPASERGQTMLMKGRDLWIFLPNVSQPVRLSLAQRLTGQVANGDLARANFAGDYAPKLLRTDTIDGQKYYVLELTAVDRGVTYNKVIYWVQQANFWPHKAEFYSLSDRLLKTCSYQDFKSLGGKTRPTKLVMEDTLRKGEQSVLEYSSMRLRDLPDKIFTKEYLKKLD